MKRTQRHAPGSIVFDRRRGKWQHFWYEAGKRRSRIIGTRQQYPTKAAAWKAIERLQLKPITKATGETAQSVVNKYEAERIPTRFTTAYTCRSFLKNRVLPRWGETLIQDVQPRVVELWLRQLPLPPKSKTHVRSLMHGLVEFAMFAGILEIGRNPISLVENKGASKRVR